MTTQKLSKSKRLNVLGELFGVIACGIRNAQQALTGEDYSADTVSLVADALGRLGWLADQGCICADDKIVPVVGDANEWLLGRNLSKQLERCHAAGKRVESID